MSIRRLLIVGGGGHVGQVIVPAMERAFDCSHFDLQPVRWAERPTMTADVGDDRAVEKAVSDKDAVLYLAMGSGGNSISQCPTDDIGAAFSVNTQGVYRFLYYSLKAGVKNFLYTSTLTVYNRSARDITKKETDSGDEDCVITEKNPPNAWRPYGLSKRLGEFICRCAAAEYPQTCIMALRIFRPYSDRDWPKYRHYKFFLGPRDTERLFIAAVQFDKPGFHIIQATGDREERHYSNKEACELLGWKPQNE